MGSLGDSKVSALCILALWKRHQEVALHEGIAIHRQGVQGIVRIQLRLWHDRRVSVNRVLFPTTGGLNGFQGLSLPTFRILIILIMLKYLKKNINHINKINNTNNMNKLVIVIIVLILILIILMIFTLLKILTI